MLPALELVDDHPDISGKSGCWQLWLKRNGWYAVCYVHADGYIGGTTLWVDGTAWPVTGR